MSWHLKGSYVETCSCELMCPCNLSFDHGATYDFCRVTLVFNIREGEIEGTDIGGLKVAAIADTPKVMTDGNWRLGVFVDERATDEQLEKLVQVFGGQLGGPMAALAPLVGEMLGVERAAIEVRDDGLRHSVRVGDVIDFEIEDIVPFGVETGRAGSLRWHVPSGGVGPHDGGGEALTDQRLRHRLRGQDRVCRRPSSPGPPEPVIAATPERRAGEAVSRRRIAAARSRLGIVAALFALAGGSWWWTVDQMRGHGRRAMDRSRNAGLVRRRLGRDDGGDDVPVGRPDGRPVLAHDQAALRALAAAVRGGLSRSSWAGAGVVAFAIAAAGGRDRRRRARVGSRRPVGRRRDAASSPPSTS